MGIMAPVVGFLVDRYGTRKMLFFGAIAVGVGLILLGFTQSLLMFYGAFIIMSFGAGGCTAVVTTTAVANWFYRKASKAFGIMASGFGASGLMVPLIVWLVDSFGWRQAVFTLGMGAFLVCIPLSLIVRNRPEDLGYFPDGAASPPEKVERDDAPSVPQMSFREAFRDRTFLYLNIAEGIRMMALASVVVHVMPYLGSIGIPRATAGIMAAAVPLLSILGRIGFGVLGDIMDKRHVAIISFALMAAGLFIFSRATSIAGICLFLILFSPGFGGGMVMRGAIVREYYGRDFFGAVIGIIMGTSSFGGIIGPTVAGMSYDAFANYRIVWLAGSVCVMASAFLFLLMKQKVIKASEARQVA